MNNYTFTENGFTFERISKKIARTAFNNGLTVFFCPCKMRPFNNPWGGAVPVKKSNETFEQVLNAYEYYNCNYNELGKYTAFYIPVCEIDRFTGEKPTPETIGTVKSYDYSYLEKVV